MCKNFTTTSKSVSKRSGIMKKRLRKSRFRGVHGVPKNSNFRNFGNRQFLGQRLEHLELKPYENFNGVLKITSRRSGIMKERFRKSRFRGVHGAPKNSNFRNFGNRQFLGQRLEHLELKPYETFNAVLKTTSKRSGIMKERFRKSTFRGVHGAPKNSNFRNFGNCQFLGKHSEHLELKPCKNCNAVLKITSRRSGIMKERFRKSNFRGLHGAPKNSNFRNFGNRQFLGKRLEHLELKPCKNCNAVLKKRRSGIMKERLQTCT